MTGVIEPQQLAELVASVARPRPDPSTLGPDTILLLTGLELDSLSLLELVLGLERQFGVVMPPEDVHGGNLGTIGRLQAYLARAAPLP